MVYRRDEVEKNAFFIGIFFQSSLQLQQYLAVSENVRHYLYRLRAVQVRSFLSLNSSTMLLDLHHMKLQDYYKLSFKVSGNSDIETVKSFASLSKPLKTFSSL